MQTISAAGPWVYPLSVLALCLVASIWRAVLAIHSDRPVPPAGPPHHAVVAWGVLAVVVGLLGTVIGFARLASGARAVARSEEGALQAVLQVVWEGAMIVVSPVVLGLWLFTASMVAWLVLGFMLNRQGVEGPGRREA